MATDRAEGVMIEGEIAWVGASARRFRRSKAFSEKFRYEHSRSAGR